jgi:pSer/pThr/pTyr-binding forkhead associated (FHA) protein
MDKHEQPLNQSCRNVSLEVIQGPDRGKKVSFRPGMIIGRDPQTCHLTLSDANVSRQHSRINLLGSGRYSVEDLQSTNGTWLGGQRLQAAAPLTAGGTFQIGSSVLRLNAAEVGAADLQVTIGRGPENTLIINDADVSRQHALLVFSDGQVTINDLNSTNGTFVDNRKISVATVLQPDAKISIGKERYLFNGRQLLSLQGQVLYEFQPGASTAGVFPNREQVNSVPLPGKVGLQRTFLLPGLFFCGLSLLLLVLQFHLVTFFAFIMILGLIFILKDKIATNFKQSLVLWLIGFFVLLAISALTLPGEISFSGALVAVGLKMISVIMVLVFILSILVLAFSFRKAKRVSLPAVFITLAVSFVSLIIFSNLIGYRASFAFWLLMALTGGAIGYLWARSTSVYLENNRVMSRNSIWYLVIWGGVFALNQLITISANRPPTVAMAMLIISTFIVWGTNGSILQRYFRLQPVSRS